MNTGSSPTRRFCPRPSLAAVRNTSSFTCSALSVMVTYLPPPRTAGLVPEPSEYWPGLVSPVVS